MIRMIRLINNNSSSYEDFTIDVLRSITETTMF